MIDIEKMKNAHDVRGLIRLLDHGNPDIQWRAADALGSFGEMACDPLLRLLTFPRINVRIGAIEALGNIHSPRSVEPLIHTLATDESNEVRWVASLALGEIGDKRAILPLVNALRDEDRYVRYGSATSLKMFNWGPEDDTAKAYSLIALQDWDAIKKLEQAAVEPLTDMLKDKNPVTRENIVELLGKIRGSHSIHACEAAIKDSDPAVRWKAVLSARKCGMSNTRVPLIISRRPWTTPNPVGAAILNFFCLGTGYSYLQKWYGGIITASFLTIMVFVQLYTRVPIPYIYAYPFTWIPAVHTYYMVRKMHDL